MPRHIINTCLRALAIMGVLATLAGCDDPPVKRFHIDSAEAVSAAWQTDIATLEEIGVFEISRTEPADSPPPEAEVHSMAVDYVLPIVADSLARRQMAPVSVMQLVDRLGQSELVAWHVQTAITRMLGVMPQGGVPRHRLRNMYLDDLSRRLAELPRPIRAATLELATELFDAATAAEAALAKLDADDRRLIRENGLAFLEGTLDADRSRRIVSMIRRVNMPLMAQAAWRLTEAAGKAARTYAAFARTDAAKDIDFSTEALMGRIVVTGTDDDVHAKGALLIVDLGGDDRYTAPVGSSYWSERPASLSIDIAGDDRYEPTRYFGIASGVLGIGVAMDLAGSDTWGTDDDRGTQGFGLFGIGVLADLGGNDRYTARHSAQGAAAVGLGLLLDGAGADSYRIGGLGQGAGFIAGAGAIVDRSGPDIYRAGGDSATGDASSSKRSGLAQGVAIAPARSTVLPGGFGLVADLGGNDVFEATVDAQARAQRLGLGALVNVGGDDTYTAITRAQAMADDGGVAVSIDTSGRDQYTVNRLGQATALGRSVAVLYEGAGNDFYRGSDRTRGFGRGVGSFAVFADNAGVDHYEFTLDEKPSPITRSIPIVPDSTRAFLELGGDDTYLGGVTVRDNGGVRLDTDRFVWQNDFQHLHSGGALIADQPGRVWSRIHAEVEGLPEAGERAIE